MNKIYRSLPNNKDEKLTLLLDEYFRDIPRQEKRLATEETAEFVMKNLPTTPWSKNRWEVLDLGIKSAPHIDGIWMELGIYMGKTINYIAKQVPKINIYGLDSFKGLPESWRADFQKGEFKTDKKPKTLKNVIVYDGYFDKTIPKILSKDKRPLSFLHIGCDLYSSTKTAFDLLSPRIVSGTVFVFDEFFNYPGWQRNEYKAFMELITKNNLKYDFLTYTKNHSQMLIKFE